MRDRTGRRQRLGDWISIAVTVVALVSLATWAIVRFARGDDTGDEHPLTHVHGLGLNPADGSLIVATHHGTFRADPDDGDLTLIGESRQDTMGFTVVGPDHFLGSGHPDLAGRRDGQPAQLGLIQSTDGGTSWTAVSLRGEADFHALAATTSLVYGWDAGTGRFMASSDQREWGTRSTIDMFTFAVDPDDVEHVLAATPNGLTESLDGGRTWTSTDGPTAVVLSWSPDVGLWAAEADGAVWVLDRSDWIQRSQLQGVPEAMLATTETLYAAIQDVDASTRVDMSVDRGRSWQPLTH